MIRTDRQTMGRIDMMTQRDRYFHFRFPIVGGNCLRNRICFQLF